MQRTISLLKANLSEGMNLFKINTKNKSKSTQILLPLILTISLMGMMGMYAQGLIENLAPLHLEFVVLTIFLLAISILTLLEGIYKSGSLLFNCKDDNLLFSLPIRKQSVLFLRIFKFYLFELMYNSVFLIPSMIVYAIAVHPSISFYFISLLGLLLFPIVPIVLSCILGALTTFVSSKFKGKNFVQTVLTIILLLGIMFVSYNADDFLTNIASNAKSINEIITKLYYPAGAYIELITDFKWITLFLFVIIHVLLMVITVFVLGKVYLSINSSTKSVRVKRSNKKAVIKTSSVTKSLIKKECNRFINSPVFVINAGFGLVLFIIFSIAASLKYNDIVASFLEANPEMNTNTNLIAQYMPVIIFILISFTSFTTSITCAMISLEGKTFNLLKSLPIKPKTIINMKVLTAVLIMLPCILLGDIILFIRFKLDILSIFLLLIASFLLPLISETIGIIFNLKYPKMDANNDTEAIKQSISSMASIFTGFFLLGISTYFIMRCMDASWSPIQILGLFIGVYGVIYLLLDFYLNKTSEKYFNNIIT